MPSTLPEGEPSPIDGALPLQASETLGQRPFGFYVHVPFCAVRCGYCDFNTYTSAELGHSPGASRAGYAESVIAEIQLARRALGDRDLPVETVFFGGGTPTLLSPSALTSIVTALRNEFGLEPDAEITTESNPDSVSATDLEALRAGGINRVSFGMQSAVPTVLQVLDRTHDPRRVPQVVAWARDAGFEQVSLDLIYGTPGESLADWQRSLDAVVALEPDHVSGYALIVEEGTALARRVRRGVVPRPDDDDLADKYEVADAVLEAAGFAWYEVSNWARNESARCRHNLGYWAGTDWWGAGPGAHSHVSGVRWWNVKHPMAYAARLAAGESPAAGREILDGETRRVERVLLETRLATGLSIDVLDRAGRAGIPDLVGDGLVQVTTDTVLLTRRGRLLADAVVRGLLA
ncbi:MAG: radical SAM family heme chaperone HemW [Actinomycetota bacterium]|nr:coproporphyrinogen III oxidase [Nocardioidaceae bacterium]MDQ3480709.1 radical SAM family heme chaperone HemW [Actinomycetota bacterium]